MAILTSSSVTCRRRPGRLGRGLLDLLLSYVHAGHVCHLSVTEPPLALLGRRTAPVLTHGPAASVCGGVWSPGVQAWGSGLSEGCLSLEIRCQLIPEREVQPERGLVFLNKSFLLLTCALDVRFLICLHSACLLLEFLGNYLTLSLCIAIVIFVLESGKASFKLEIAGDFPCFFPLTYSI